MFCARCGKEISDQVKFCPKCGAPVSDAENGVSGGSAPAGAPAEPSPQPETTTATADKPEKKKKGKKVLWAVVLVLAFFFVVGLLNPPEESSEEDASPQGKTDAVPLNAEAALLEIIDRAEALRAANDEAFNALHMDKDDDGDGLIDDVEVYMENCRKAAQLQRDFVTELAALREEASAISGLDDSMKSARDEYFEMLSAAKTAHAEAYEFYGDYFDFFDNVISWRPYEVDYDDINEYAETLSAWTQECRERYAAISYPSCVESEWQQYEEILEYNESIASKLSLAIRYNDWLRYYSTQYMSSRYTTVEENLYGKMLDCISNEFTHVSRQLSTAANLAQEMHSYAELDQAAREGYEFENNRKGRILLSYEAVDTIYPSLYNTYDAFIILKTGCISGTRSIVVEAEIEGFSQTYRQSFNLDSSYKAIYIKPPALTGELDLTAAKPAQIKVTVTEKDGTLIDAKTFSVTIKSKYDFDWYSDDYGISTRDNILCFLTPHAKAVEQLKRDAIDEISAITGGQIESFPGYQYITPQEYSTTYLEAAGLMSALYAKGVRYNMDAFTISGSNQHILFPEDVLESRSGLCVETSLVIASALKCAGMHAFLLFPPGHTQVAVEMWSSGDWAGRYYLIETTALEEAVNNTALFAENFQNVLEGYAPNAGTCITYMDSAQWNEYLSNTFAYDVYVVDCDDIELLGMTPFVN